MNYTVVEATAVIATHLTELIKSHAHELLTRQEVKNLLDNLKARVPALIEEVIPTQVKPGELQKVMQNLLRERVPVRDLETILETLGDFASRTKDLEVLTEYVRIAWPAPSASNTSTNATSSGASRSIRPWRN